MVIISSLASKTGPGPIFIKIYWRKLKHRVFGQI
jgi:hypothetical protein